MASKKRYLIGTMVVLLLLGIVAGLVIPRAGRATGRRLVTLVDGRVVEFLGTSMGDTPFTTDTKWERVVRRVLPTFMGNWMPAPIVAHFDGASNSLSVYVKFKNSPVIAVSANGSPFIVEAEDTSGFRYPWEGTAATFYPASGVGVSCFTVRAFPRRQPDFLVYLLDARTGSDLGQFRARNPAFHEYPVWHPTPLPLAQTNGPVSLTLAGLVKHATGKSRFLVPQWGLEAIDPVWSNAEVVAPTIQDATGNEGQLLSPSEPAWRIRASVWRRQPDEFSAEEKFVLTNVAIPAKVRSVAINQSAERAGVHLEVVSLELFSRPDGGNHCLIVSARNLAPKDDLQFQIVNDRGQTIKVIHSDYAPQPDGARMYRTTLERFNGAKTVTMEIIVNRSLPFEFLVNPKDARTTDP